MARLAPKCWWWRGQGIDRVGIDLVLEPRPQALVNVVAARVACESRQAIGIGVHDDATADGVGTGVHLGKCGRQPAGVNASVAVGAGDHPASAACRRQPPPGFVHQAGAGMADVGDGRREHDLDHVQAQPRPPCREPPHDGSAVVAAVVGEHDNLEAVWIERRTVGVALRGQRTQRRGQTPGLVADRHHDAHFEQVVRWRQLLPVGKPAPADDGGSKCERGVHRPGTKGDARSRQGSCP